MWKRYLKTNYEINEWGIIRNAKTKKVLTPILKQNGYVEIRLSIEGKVKNKRLHRVIYEAYNGKIDKNLHINHINGIKTDNSIQNLEAVSCKENNRKRVFLRRGEQINTAKLTEEQVLEIRRRKANGDRTLDLAKEYGLTKGAINRLASGKTWKHLPILKTDNTVWGNSKITGAMSGKELQKKYGKDYFSRIAKAQKIKERCPHCGQIIK